MLTWSSSQFDPMQTSVPTPLLTKIRPLHIFRLVDTTCRLHSSEYGERIAAFCGPFAEQRASNASTGVPRCLEAKE
jgi:hypothetical protein